MGFNSGFKGLIEH